MKTNIDKKGTFAFLYCANRNDMGPIAEYYNPPEQFKHAKEYKVATVPKERGGDGQTVQVFEIRFPATFFRLKVLAGKNSIGKKQNGYTLTTGSGQNQLAGHIAKAIASGMLGFYPSKNSNVESQPTAGKVE